MVNVETRIFTLRSPQRENIAEGGGGRFSLPPPPFQTFQLGMVLVSFAVGARQPSTLAAVTKSQTLFSVLAVLMNALSRMASPISSKAIAPETPV